MNPTKRMPSDEEQRVDDLVEVEPETAHDEGLDDDSDASPNDVSDDPDAGSIE